MKTRLEMEVKKFMLVSLAIIQLRNNWVKRYEPFKVNYARRRDKLKANSWNIVQDQMKVAMLDNNIYNSRSVNC